MASSNVSCWRTYRTPTLAKSSTSSVAVNAELELVADDDAEVVLAAGVDDGGGQILVKVFVTMMVVVGGTDEDETPSVNVVVDDGPAMTVIVAALSSLTAAASTIPPDVPVMLDTVSAAALRLVLWPLKVTRAFSEVQLRLPALSFERIVVPSRDTEKLL